MWQRDSITSQEYMDKLEHFVRVRTAQVEQSNYQYALRQFFDAAAANYKSKPTGFQTRRKNHNHVKRFYSCKSSGSE